MRQKKLINDYTLPLFTFLANKWRNWIKFTRLRETCNLTKIELGACRKLYIIWHSVAGDALLAQIRCKINNWSSLKKKENYVYSRFCYTVYSIHIQRDHHWKIYFSLTLTDLNVIVNSQLWQTKHYYNISFYVSWHNNTNRKTEQRKFNVSKRLHLNFANTSSLFIGGQLLFMETEWEISIT